MDSFVGEFNMWLIHQNHSVFLPQVKWLKESISPHDELRGAETVQDSGMKMHSHSVCQHCVCVWVMLSSMLSWMLKVMEKVQLDSTDPSLSLFVEHFPLFIYLLTKKLQKCENVEACVIRSEDVYHASVRAIDKYAVRSVLKVGQKLWFCPTAVTITQCCH